MKIEWVPMPSAWVSDDGYPLTKLRWVSQDKAAYIAALKIYICLLHYSEKKTLNDWGEVKVSSLSYSQISDISNVSRALISKGLDVLYEQSLIYRELVGRKNLYIINDFDSVRFGKLPMKAMYAKHGDVIEAFQNFKHRQKVELNALKIYLLIVAFRDNSSNATQIGYDKITEYTGVRRAEIKAAISVLAANELIRVEHTNSDHNEFSTSNVYRLCGIETNRRQMLRN